MMENLQSLESLDSLFAKIADIMGLAVDQVQANGMDYVLEYGRYCFAKELASTIGGFLIFGSIIMGLVWIGMGAWFQEDFDFEKPFVKSRNISIAIYVLVFLTVLINYSLPYLMSPTMYSIEKCLQLLN